MFVQISTEEYLESGVESKAEKQSSNFAIEQQSPEQGLQNEQNTEQRIEPTWVPKMFDKDVKIFPIDPQTGRSIWNSKQVQRLGMETIEL